MSFSIDKITHHYINTIPQNSDGNKRTESGNMDKKFDEVLITSTNRQIEEKKMSESMTRDVMSQVTKPVSHERLEELKQQVESGQYQVDVEEIAGRILLQRGAPLE